MTFLSQVFLLEDGTTDNKKIKHCTLVINALYLLGWLEQGN